MNIQRQQGFCLLETTITLTLSGMLIVLLTAILSHHITTTHKLNNDLSSATQTLTLYKQLKNLLSHNCKASGSKNLVTGNDTLKLSCCENNSCTKSRIYLSKAHKLYTATSSQPEQIAQDICNFSLEYGTVHNNNLSYHKTAPTVISALKADITLCSQPIKHSMEFAL